MDSIKPKLFANFQTSSYMPVASVSPNVKRYLDFEDKTQANELLQKYYVQNAGNVIINPQLNSDERIFTPDEIKAIKNLSGTVAEKADKIKGIYLEKKDTIKI